MLCTAAIIERQQRLKARTLVTRAEIYYAFQSAVSKEQQGQAT